MLSMFFVFIQDCYHWLGRKMIVAVDLFATGISISRNKIINFFLNKVCEKNTSLS